MTNSTTASPDDYVPSLMTNTPYEGRQLAITLARKSIHEMQSDPEIKARIRRDYSQNGADLIAAGHVIATEFRTIAEANDYWRQ
ncbi:MAG: hexameric tyrosine-coordinated heme protein [Pseudomonadota bacterium]